MQRVSQRVLLIGRSIYGSLLGKKPAIKPPPTPPSTRSPSPPAAAVFAATPSTSSDISVRMDNQIPFPSAFENVPTHHNEIGNANAEITSYLSVNNGGVTTRYDDDVEQGIRDNTEYTRMNNAAMFWDNKSESDTDTQATFSSKIDGLETECVSATAPSIDAAHTSEENSHGLGTSIAVVEMTNEVDDTKGKRLREKDKRKSRHEAKTSVSGNYDTSTIAAAGDGSDTGPPSKKEKTSEKDSQGKAKVEAFVENEDKPKRKNKRRAKKKGKKEFDQGNTTECEDMGIPLRPNFFMAIQIADKNILSKVSQLQQTLSEKTLSTPWHSLKTTEIFKDAMVPVQKLHFTLHVMHLKGDEDIEKAQQVLKDCWNEVRQDYIDDPMDLTIEGLGHFKNNVLFAQIKEEKHILRLEKLSYLIQTKFAELKISGEPRPFKPHMTIAKISRSNKLHKKRIRTFPPEMWSGYEETNFGVQHVNSLQLLCMAGEDKLTGYYRCFGQQYFQDPLLLGKSASSEEASGTLSEENHVNVVPSNNIVINDHDQSSNNCLQSQSDNSSTSGSLDSKL